MEKSVCHDVLTEIINAVEDPIYATDRRKGILLANDAFCRFAERSRSELIGRSAADFFPAAEAEVLWANSEETFATQAETITEEQVTDAAGRTHLMVIKRRFCRDGRGQEMVIGVLRDVTGQRQSEQRLAETLAFQQTLIEAAPLVAVLCCKESGEVVSVNAAAAAISGSSDKQILKLNLRQADSLRVSGILAAMDEVLATGRGGSRDFELATSLNGTRWLRARIALFSYEQERYLLMLARDITDERRMEQALRNSDERYRVLFNTGNDAIFVHPPLMVGKPPGKFIEVNDVACRRLGYSREELLQLSPPDINAAESKADLPRRLAGFEAGVKSTWEGTHVTKDGRKIPVEIHAQRFELNGEPMVLAEVRDLTERKAAETALRESDALYQSLMRHLPCGVYRKDEAGRYVYANDWFYEKNGLPRGLIVGKTPAEVARELQAQAGAPGSDAVNRQHIDLANEGAADHRQIMETGQTLASEGVMNLPDGTTRYFHMIRSPVMATDGRIIGSQAMQLDITGLKAAEQALLQSEQRLRKLSLAVEQSPVSIVITDLEGKIEYVNPKFVAVTGYALDEVLGQNTRLLKSGANPPELYQDLWKTILAGREWHGEFCNKKKNGDIFWESVSISPISAQGKVTHFLAVKEDITAQRRLEDEFRQAQKMEAFGRLAAGVAHDFNNMMTAVLCSANLLEIDRPLTASQKDAVAEIINAANRAAALTRQLLMFSRRQAVQLKVLDLNGLVENMGKMLRRLIGEHISLETHFEPGGAPVLADPGMLEQVLMNLVVNSRDAMANGGELIIRIRTLKVVNPVGRQRRGEFVRLSVSDTGCGIAPKDMEHIFEPFFTTKEIGKGTGLGLATVFGIVQQHKGWIEVESQPGQGTNFHIFLPREAAPVGQAPADSPKPCVRGGGETILLVEDDTILRSLARNILVRHGYLVFEAGSGPAAHEVWRTHREEIDLLFTDVVMPGQMSGVELAQQLLKEKPALKVVYASGYTEELPNEGSRLRQAQNFIEKPYSPELLLRKIRKAFT